MLRRKYAHIALISSQKHFQAVKLIFWKDLEGKITLAIGIIAIIKSSVVY